MSPSKGALELPLLASLEILARSSASNGAWYFLRSLGVSSLVDVSLANVRRSTTIHSISVQHMSDEQESLRVQRNFPRAIIPAVETKESCD